MCWKCRTISCYDYDLRFVRWDISVGTCDAILFELWDFISLVHKEWLAMIWEWAFTTSEAVYIYCIWLISVFNSNIAGNILEYVAASLWQTILWIWLKLSVLLYICRKQTVNKFQVTNEWLFHLYGWIYCSPWKIRNHYF